MKKILLLISLIALCACECPYREFGERRFEEPYYKPKYDSFSANTLMGGWQCSSNMYIVGIGEILGDQPNTEYQMMWISFINYKQCDITLKAKGSVDSRVYTFDYLYDGNTLRFSLNHRTLILTLSGFIYPELYLRDSYGRYTITKKRVAGY